MWGARGDHGSLSFWTLVYAMEAQRSTTALSLCYTTTSTTTAALSQYHNITIATESLKLSIQKTTPVVIIILLVWGLAIYQQGYLENLQVPCTFIYPYPEFDAGLLMFWEQSYLKQVNKVTWFSGGWCEKVAFRILSLFDCNYSGTGGDSLLADVVAPSWVQQIAQQKYNWAGHIGRIQDNS